VKEVAMTIESRLLVHFQNLPEPRIVKKCDHRLLDIVMIALCATIANADTWEEIAEFGRSKRQWFQSWLELPEDIPSASTFKRVFELLDAQAFQTCFQNWVAEVFQLSAGQVVAIDGKTARGTCDKSGKAHLHLVSAWASENALSLGQVKVADKTNEITAIPTLLDLLMLKGCIVTIDAMGCQKNISQAIREKEADYVLMVKKNHPKVYEYLEAAFAQTELETWAEKGLGYAKTYDKGHGREEEREAWVLPDAHLKELGWHDCQSIIRLARKRQEHGQAASLEIRYYISSLAPDAARLLAVIRAHWTIENNCHWLLDVVFHEDAARTRTRHADNNQALLRKIALNLLKQDHSKGSLNNKRYRAAVNEDFLTQVLTSSFNLMP
jgi:predicted transposase YbfD/YdcC